MKRRSATPAQPAQMGGRPVWAAYAVGFLAFAAGLALLVGGRLAPGAGLALLGIVAVTAGYLLPFIPLAAWAQALRPAPPAPVRGPAKSAGPAQEKKPTHIMPGRS